ncbi:MAG TPA: DUF3048 domain-containing protein, partial [Anaerolineales bacterium]|nr:DUF3048 domain-containing protein [Anaerolineales bacterium]
MVDGNCDNILGEAPLMKKIGYLLLFLTISLSACGRATPTASPIPAVTEKSSPTMTIPPAPTASAGPAATAPIPTEGYGPSSFPLDVDPLTGLKVADPALLQRRPMLIKVSNLPRNVRPQWGLSLADIVFEYYAEEGST